MQKSLKEAQLYWIVFKFNKYNFWELQHKNKVSLHYLTETLLRWLSFSLWFYSHFMGLALYFTALRGLYLLNTSPKFPESY